MKPSIGRTVHYVTGGFHHAAIVTHVSGEFVDLEVFPSPRVLAHVDRTPIVVPYSEEPIENSWHWPEREAE